MKSAQLINEGQGKISDCAVDYEAVDLSLGDYLPHQPFRSLHIGTAGDITLLSPASGRRVTFSVTPGCWPYAGKGITQGGTSAGAIVALF